MVPRRASPAQRRAPRGSRHQGYIAQFSVSREAGGERTLTATLGRVERESQSGEEVTQQYVDLVARLSNSRSTGQRLV